MLAFGIPVAWARDGSAPESGAADPEAVARSLRVPRVFGDSMVLQRGREVPVWGWARAGETVHVRFAGESHTARTGKDGRWQVRLSAMPASTEPRRLVVASEGGKQTLAFEDVLVGDVYLAGGQSNMAIGLSASDAGPKEVKRANHPTLRFLRVRTVPSPDRPAVDVTGEWAVCTPQTAARFSAVAYYFGRRLVTETGVPVGIIQVAQGNSWAESWIPRETLETSPAGRAYSRAWDEAEARFDPDEARARDARRMAAYHERVAAVRAAVRKVKPHRLRRPRPTVAPRAHRGWPGTLYNGMIAPLEPFALRGALWYQGEHNARVRGYAYRSVLTTLIERWRRGFENPELEFYIVQLAEWGPPASKPRESAIAEARESQLRVHREVPHTGLVVTIDTAEKGSTHPKNKQLPGERLALWALARKPGSDVDPSGPLFESQRVEGRRIVLSFSHTDGGLVVGRRSGSVAVRAVDEPLASFAIAGEDREFVRAEAEIRGDEVVVWSDAVSAPVAVRYAWADNPVGSNLYNRAGLPASPFRTDDWPVSTQGVLEPRLPMGHRAAKPLPAGE